MRKAEKVTLTYAQSWIQEGIAIGETRGKEKGKAEGKAEGKVEGKIESTLTLLESRFGEIPDSIQKKLVNVRDDISLGKVLKLAAMCQSLKEFQKTL